MINIPMSKIKEKILEETDIEEDTLDERIKEKLDQLSGLISEEGAAHIVANELGVKLTQTSGRLEIDNIVSGMRDVEVAGKAYRVFEVREFEKKDRKGKVGNFILADDTGTIRIVLWNDHADLLEDIDEGDTILIESGYVRENRGRSEIHLNERSALKVNPEGVTVDVDFDDIGPSRKKLVDLEESDDNVIVLATIVQVFEPRFFEVCPGCGKRARESGDAYKCETHGNVNDPDYSYVMNLFLDDGSDNVRTVLWRNSVQGLLDMEDDEVKQFREDPSAFEEIKTELLGNIVKVRGRVQHNENFDRLELVARYVERNPDPEEEMESLEEEAGKAEAEPADTEETEDNQKAKVETKTSIKKEEKKQEAQATVSDEAMDEGMMDEDEMDVEEMEFDDDEDIPSIDEL